MQNRHTTTTDYADDLMAIPKAHLALELTQDERGLKLSHSGKRVAECYLTREGMMAATYLAQALGTKVPPLGETVKVRVSTGVLFRAVSIVNLDFNNEVSYVLLERWLEEAEEQRGGVSEL